MAGLPDLLTIEEAARVLRVGRTKAYAMAREWRATGGTSGLPVVDFGHALRVPLFQLEKLLGGPLSANAQGDAAKRDEPTPESELDADSAPEPDADSAPEPDSGPARPTPAVSATPGPDAHDSRPHPPRPSPRRRPRTPDQPTLPFAS